MRARGNVIECRSEGVTFSGSCRLLCKEKHIALSTVILILSLDKSVEIANSPQRIDFHVKEQLKRKNIEDHWLAQIRLWQRSLRQGGARLQQLVGALK